MLGCRWAKTSGRIVAGAALVIGLGARGAEASLVKSDGSPPLLMPGTLLVEAGERSDGAAPAHAATKIGRAVADTKVSPRTCSAAVVQVPNVGIRIVTAGHCADHRSLEVLDEQHHAAPVAQLDAREGVDLAALEMEGTIPWKGLVMRSAATVHVGERLCAWHLRREDAAIARERICGRVVRQQPRAGAAPLLVMNHPYPAGTSGSALVDHNGRVVGIVVASTGFGGLAEPIDEVLRLPLEKARR